MAIIGEHAVVLGASMAGLLAARVVSEHYRNVTVVDRDELPEKPANRRGVPQGSHGHALQAGGSAILEELFPGILDELVADGSPVWSDGDLTKVIVEYGGHPFLRSGVLPGAPSALYPSRPFLDWHVLQRVSRFYNVHVLGGHDVVGLTATADCRGVVGVKVARRGTAENTLLRADLVVDATGRGSRAPVFLGELGYDRPVEDELMVNLSYTSQWLRLPPGAIRECMVALFAKPGDLSTVALLGHENDTWLMTVGAMAGRRAGPGLRRHAPDRGEARPRAHPRRVADRRAHRRAGALPGAVQPVAPLRQDGPVPERVGHHRRRGVQLQPDLRPGHDGGGPGCDRVAALSARRGPRPGAPVLPGQRQDRSGGLA